MRRHSLDILSLIFSFMALLSACERKQPPALPGNPAPAFSIKDTNGAVVRLQDFAGKVVVIDFWATWCGPCKEATKELEALHRQYGSRGVAVIGISVDKGADAAAKVQEYQRTAGLTYRLLIDDGSAYKAYGIARVPATIILDRQHVIRATYPGFRPGIGREIALEIEKYL